MKRLSTGVAPLLVLLAVAAAAAAAGAVHWLNRQNQEQRIAIQILQSSFRSHEIQGIPDRIKDWSSSPEATRAQTRLAQNLAWAFRLEREIASRLEAQLTTPELQHLLAHYQSASHRTLRTTTPEKLSTPIPNADSMLSDFVRWSNYETGSVRRAALTAIGVATEPLAGPVSGSAPDSSDERVQKFLPFARGLHAKLGTPALETELAFYRSQEYRKFQYHFEAGLAAGLRTILASP